MPLSAETPAPVRTVSEREPAINEATVSMFSDRATAAC
jgi:hypothetical protein